MTIHQYALSKVSCAGCVRSIEKALNASDDISDFAINFADRTATVESNLPTTEVEQLIINAGYGAALIENEEDLAARDQQNQQELKQTFTHAWVAIGLGAFLMVQMLAGLMPPVESSEGLVNGLITATLSAMVMFHSGGHIFRGALQSFKRLDFNMDTLIALGTGVAWLYSALLLMFIQWIPESIPTQARHLYFEASVMIIGFILLGQALEAKGRNQTAEALRHLMNLQPKTALKVIEGEAKEVSIQLLLPGDLVRVLPGQTIPVDALVVEGSSYVDESMLTGESVPVQRQIDDQVTGGTLNGEGVLLVRVTEVGQKTRLAQILSSVREAQNSKPALGKLADKIASIFVPVVIFIALLVFTIWWFVGPEPTWSYATLASMTVLIVACPCALGLATPMAVMVGVGRAAKMGVLIREGDALQRSQDLTCVVMDKTGTLTQGKPSLTHQHAAPEYAAIAKTLASHSEHPLSKALSHSLEGGACEVDQFRSISGSGVEAVIDDETYRLGSGQWMETFDIDSSDFVCDAEAWSEEGASLVWLFNSSRVLALFALNDALRDDSQSAVERFKVMGLRLVLLSGDHSVAAEAIAKQAGISEVIAGVQPEQKLQTIAQLQAEGEVVAMVGDGINDAPALAQADVGYAMGGGTDVALASADVALMQNSLHAVADAIQLSRLTVNNIKQNLFGAFFYNVAAIPVAAGILYPVFGLLLNPMIAGAAMALSSVTVVANARRLNQVNLSR
ncbi:heavy metal translocating P-type ATPase [Marinobacterium sp. xm-d-564]|uniref:heavy metal translocating P-type ATPase n=1 Tax=Marinobacterium sp. xm-d-564 TaxID=2497742 RepID=UPI001569D2A9|nr:heavy metal translocating P-type ATPase [Marinobacterium sp. xm-d-564]NRP59630.1 Copper-exporting P-type ATPase A [Marinobacterium sp. xm-d-564]